MKGVRKSHYVLAALWGNGNGEDKQQEKKGTEKEKKGMQKRKRKGCRKGKERDAEKEKKGMQKRKRKGCRKGKERDAGAKNARETEDAEPWYKTRSLKDN